MKSLQKIFTLALILIYACTGFISCSPKLNDGNWIQISEFTLSSGSHRVNIDRDYKDVRFKAEGGSAKIDYINVIMDDGKTRKEMKSTRIPENDFSSTLTLPHILGYPKRMDIYFDYQKQSLVAQILVKRNPVKVIVFAFQKSR